MPLLELDCFIYKYKSLQAGQLSTENLSFLQRWLNFIITTYLKQKVNGNLSICLDERSPCGLSTEEIKITKMLLLPTEKYPMDFYQDFPAQI